MSKSAKDGTKELYISDNIKEDIGNAGCIIENANVDSGKCQVSKNMVSNTPQNVRNVGSSILEAGTGTNVPIINGGPVDETANDCILNVFLANAPDNSPFYSTTKYDIFEGPDDKKVEFGNNMFSVNTTDKSSLNSITKCAVLVRSDDEKMAFEKNELQSNTANGTQFNFTTKYTLLAEHDDRKVEFGNNIFSANTTDESSLNSITKCAVLVRSDDENVAFGQNELQSNTADGSQSHFTAKYPLLAEHDDKKVEFGNNMFSVNTTDESSLNSITKCAALARSDDENVAFGKNELQSNTADESEFHLTAKDTLLMEHDDEFVTGKILIDENMVCNGNYVELQNTVLTITVNEGCVLEVPENVRDLNTVDEIEMNKIPDNNLKENNVDDNSKATDSNSACDRCAGNVSPGLTNEHTNSVGEEDTCCLCYKVIDIFAIGECDHQICYECASRLRVICGDRSCPVCRTYLHKVIYSAQKLPYRKLDGESWRNQKYVKKWSIACRDADIHIKFLRLLKHQCPKCDIKPYASFYDLETHLNKTHHLHFCHICTQNLNQFSFERICYTDSELKLHLNEGDVGNTSFRGHPKCHFCKNRFMDKDELYKHMRHTHYYCHLCTDSMEFFHFYYQLANHFKKHHFLCEYGSCKQLEFINAFRTEIEYKAHLAREHTEEFNKYKSRNAHKISVKKLFEPSSNDRSHALHTFTNNRIVSPSSTAATQQNSRQCINLASNTEFPALNGEATPSVSKNVNTKRVPKKIHVEAFPPLERTYRKSNIVTASFIPEEPSCSAASAVGVISSNGAVSRGTSAKPNATSVIHQRNLTTQMTALNTVTVAGSLSSNERKENNTTKKNKGAALRVNEENFPSLSAQKKSSKKNKHQK